MSDVFDMTCCKECRERKPIIVLDVSCKNCRTKMRAEWTAGVSWSEKKTCPACGCKFVTPDGFAAGVE